MTVKIRRDNAAPGYALVEILCHREQGRRYFADRNDGLCCSAFAQLAHFRLKPAAGLA